MATSSASVVLQGTQHPGDRIVHGCRSSSVNSAARYSTIQAILGRSWIIHGVSRSPGVRSESVSWVSWVSRLPQVGHLGAGVAQMHGSMVRAEVPVHLVRAGSAWHREPLVPGGHERSTSANQHRRSAADHRLDLGRRSSPALGSNPSSNCRMPYRTLACEASRTGDDTTELEPQGDDEIRRTSLDDAEGKMRDPSALDHPRALQVDRPGPEVVEQ